MSDEADKKAFITFLEKKVLPNLNLTDGSHDISHFYRVRKNGLLLADDLSARVDKSSLRLGLGPSHQVPADESMKCDRDVVEVACLLHDVVNLPKDSPDRKRAAEFSALKAYGICVGYGIVTEEFLTKIQEAIRYHSFSAEIAKSPNDHGLRVCKEALCVQDADRLDALGPIGIARCFYVCGALGGEICDINDPLAKNRPLDDRKYGLDHFEVKLYKLEGMMKTPLGRQLAKRRTEVLREFREHLAKRPTSENPIYMIAWIFHQLGKDQKPIGPLGTESSPQDGPASVGPLSIEGDTSNFDPEEMAYLSKFIEEFNADLV